MLIRTIGSLLTMTCFVGGFATAPVTAQDSSVGTVEEHIVETRHGHVYVEVAFPVGERDDGRAPAILTYSPYGALGRNQDADSFLAEGYVRVWADVLGTGNSGGCFDYGGKRERESGHDVVRWIAKQRWSSGKVAMVGAGYDGATAIAVATTAPSQLTTIIPEAAPSSWYGYSYSGGIRHSWNAEQLGGEALASPAMLTSGVALPPPSDPHNDDWGERVVSSITPCDEVEQLSHGYSDEPDYSGFWRERDYVRSANKVRVPALIAHSWGDWNVKPDHSYGLFQALRRRTGSPKVALYMGQRHSDNPVPGGDYEDVKHAWLDHYLKGTDNEIPSLPPVTSELSDRDGERGWYRGRIPKTSKLTLKAQFGGRYFEDDYPWKLLHTKPVPGLAGPDGATASFPSLGVNAESHSNMHGRNNHEWFWFESPYLKRDVRIFGEIKVQLYSKAHRRWVTLTPTIVDVDHRCHEDLGAGQHGMKAECLPDALRSITRGFLDSRYRKGLGKQAETEPVKPFAATVVTKPQDYIFKKDHIIALNVSTEIADWMVPKLYPGCESLGPQSGPSTDEQLACSDYEVAWEEGRTRVIIPVVGKSSPKRLFRPLDYVPHDH